MKIVNTRFSDSQTEIVEKKSKADPDNMCSLLSEYICQTMSTEYGSEFNFFDFSKSIVIGGESQPMLIKETDFTVIDKIIQALLVVLYNFFVVLAWQQLKQQIRKKKLRKNILSKANSRFKLFFFFVIQEQLLSSPNFVEETHKNNSRGFVF